MFMATYTAEHAGSRIAFASTVPGEIYALDVGATGGMICQKGAFLCAEETVNLNVTFSKKLSAGMFGGEGFVLQDISGTGMAFLEVDGDLVCRYLEPGEVLKVDTGNVVAFERTVAYEVEMIRGLGNIFFGGEGLFLTEAGRTWPRDHPDTERCGIRRTDRTIYSHIRKIRSYKIDYIWRKSL